MASDAKPLTDAQRQLAETHLDVVDRMVSKFRRSDGRIAVEDLRSVGRLALVEAASRYRTDGGASFRTFASIRILGAFGDETRVRAGGRRPDKKKYGRIPAPRSSPHSIKRSSRASTSAPTIPRTRSCSAEISSTARSRACPNATG